jgi:hypothetical protein
MMLAPLREMRLISAHFLTMFVPQMNLKRANPDNVMDSEYRDFLRPSKTES